MFKRNGVVIHIDSAVTIGGTQFPKGFFASPEARAEWNIVEVPDELYPDPRFWEWTPMISGSILITPRPVAECKRLMVRAAKAIRDRKTTEGGFKVMIGGVAKWFHSDLISRSQQSTLYTKAKEAIAAGMPLDTPLPIPPWRTMDKSEVILTAGDAVAIIDAAILSDGAFFRACAEHEQAIEAIEEDTAEATVKAIESYDVEGDWPPVFGE